MAELVFKNPYFSVNGTNLSSYVREIQLEYGADTDDLTAGGDNTQLSIATFKRWRLRVTLNQDYASSAVDATLFALVGANASFEVRPTTAAVGTSNPKFTGTGVVTDYPPLSGTIGQVIRTSIEFVPASDLTRATS